MQKQKSSDSERFLKIFSTLPSRTSGRGRGRVCRGDDLRSPFVTLKCCLAYYSPFSHFWRSRPPRRRRKFPPTPPASYEKPRTPSISQGEEQNTTAPVAGSSPKAPYPSRSPLRKNITSPAKSASRRNN